MNRSLSPLVLAALFACASCDTIGSAPASPGSAGGSPGGAAEPWPDAAGSIADPALAALCADAWEMRMRNDPIGATWLGDPRWHGRLPDNSPAGEERRERELRDLVRRAESIRMIGLSDADRTTLELLHAAWTLDLEEIASGVDPTSWSVDARGGPQVEFPTLAEDQPVATAREREQLLERWGRMELFVDRCSANLRRGLAAGRTAPRQAVRDVIEQIDHLLAARPEESPLVLRACGGGRFVEPVEGDPDLAVLASRHSLRAFDLRLVNERMPARVLGDGSRLLLPGEDDLLSPRERGRFAAAALATVRDRIRPAFERYRDVLEDEVLPRARDDARPGLGSLPGGESWYRLCIRRHTSLDLSPAAVHEQGRAEVARVRAEIEALGARTLGVSGLAAIQERLRGSPQMHFASAEEVIAKARASLDRARAAMPAAFGRLPGAPCEVTAVPAHEAPHSTIAYYRQPAADRSRPGRYYVNTLAPETRPRYEAEVLAFHESIPGHHLQIAIAQELEGLPLLRRHDGSTAFVEGWALYTERLCDELGLYSSDLDRLGMLSYDAWRACRLVVDTGIHALGWSRAQAIAYMRDNTLLAENNVENEVDRYIGSPGQALAYKIGQREILALREEARRALGERFDLKEFHDRVLEGGAVTLAVLRERIESWIARRSRPEEPSAKRG